MATLIYIGYGVFGVLGRLFALVLGGRRELANRRVEFRFHVLVDAWRIIERAATHGVRDDALERALADVRLFGAGTQVQLATLTSGSIRNGGGDPITLGELRDVLRVDLRSEMRLARITPESISQAPRRGTANHFEVAPHPAQLRALRPRLHLVRRANLR